VKFFARARDLAQADLVTFTMPSGTTVGALRVHLTDVLPRLAPLVPHLLVAINGDYATEHSVIAEGDEVACFPPVSGG
jgi:sulfur-carrier protein